MRALTSTTHALPHPVEVDGVSHASVTVIETIEVTLVHPIKVDGVERSTVTVRRMTSEERKAIRCRHFTKQKRGIAAFMLITGLKRDGVRQLEQVDCDTIQQADDMLDESLLAAGRTIEAGNF